MNVTQELVVAARLAKPEMSQNELAEYLGVSKQTMSNWVNGLREVKDAHIVVQIALKIGDPPGVWLEKLGREQRAPKEVLQWWHKITTAAAIAFLCVVSLPAPASKINNLANTCDASDRAMCIMFNKRTVPLANSFGAAARLVVPRCQRATRGRLRLQAQS